MIENILAGITVLLLFGLTIFVHELGHFIAARLCGFQVDAFSIGFGPAIWKKTIKGVVYKWGILPLGGYVALPQMDPSGGNPHSSADPAERKLPRVNPWKKIVVGLAGVTGNMILAFILAWVVYIGGKSYAPDRNNIVGFVETNSTAAADGFRIGDEILAVNEQAVNSWENFVVAVTLARDVTVDVRRTDGSEVKLQPRTESFMGEGWVIPGISPMNLCRVLRVIPGAVADQAGIQAGDRIDAVDGRKVFSREDLIQMINARPNEAMAMNIERKGQMFTVQISSRYDEEYRRAMIGVEFNTFDVKKPWPQIKSFAAPIFRILKALVTPHEAKAAAGQLGGPWLIFEQFWFSVKASLILALWFTVMLNVNLAILNLLPIPVLDGGHIVFTLWEIITRRPVGPRVVNAVWNVFVVLLLSVFVMLTYRDVRRTFVRKTNGPSASAAAGTNDATALPAQPAEANASSTP